MRIGFIGVGSLGKGLALALAGCGYTISSAYSRRFESSQWLADRIQPLSVANSPQELVDDSDLVFITTPDSVIAEVASQIQWRQGQAAIHCCGAASKNLLSPAASQGALTGAFHPYQTLAALEDPADAVERLTGVTFAVEGNGWVSETLRQMATDLGGRPLEIREEDRPLYHASAVLACGHLAALLNSSLSLWEEMGFSESDGLAAIIPLAQATLFNIHQQGVPASVTGPAYRGDAATVASHLDALADRKPQVLEIYKALTRESLSIASEKGLTESLSQQIEKLVTNSVGRS